MKPLFLFIFGHVLAFILGAANNANLVEALATKSYIMTAVWFALGIAALVLCGLAIKACDTSGKINPSWLLASYLLANLIVYVPVLGGVVGATAILLLQLTIGYSFVRLCQSLRIDSNAS